MRLLVTAEEVVGWSHIGPIAVSGSATMSATGCAALDASRNSEWDDHHRVDGTVWRDGAVAASFTQRVVETRFAAEIIAEVASLDDDCPDPEANFNASRFEYVSAVTTTAGLVGRHGAAGVKTTVVWGIEGAIVSMTVSGTEMEAVRTSLFDLVDAKLADVGADELPRPEAVGDDVRPIAPPDATSFEPYDYSSSSAPAHRGAAFPPPAEGWSTDPRAALAPDPRDLGHDWSFQAGWIEQDVAPLLGEISSCTRSGGPTVDTLVLFYVWQGGMESYQDMSRDDVNVWLSIGPPDRDFAGAQLSAVSDIARCGLRWDDGETWIEPAEWRAIVGADEVEAILLTRHHPVHGFAHTLVAAARYDDRAVLISADVTGEDEPLDRLAHIAGRFVEQLESGL